MTSRKPTHPGEILKEEYLVPMDISERELAEMLGVVETTVHQLIKGETKLGLSLAARLATCFETTICFWTNLQQQRDIWEMTHDVELNTAWKKVITAKHWLEERNSK